MEATAKKRISLYKYAQEMAYMSGVKLNQIHLGTHKNAEQSIMTCTDKETLDSLLSLLSLKLNVSKASFEEVLKGEKKPFQDLKTLATAIGEEQNLEKFMQKLPKPKVTESKATKKPKKKLKSNSDRVRLLNYIKTLMFLRGLSQTKVDKDLGFKSRSVLRNDILYSTEKTVLRQMEQLPFELESDSDAIKQFQEDFKSIMHGDDKPLQRLSKKYLSKVKDNRTLLMYIHILLCLHGLSLTKASKALGKTKDYIDKKAMVGTEHDLELLFDALHDKFGLNSVDLHNALERANLRIDDHVYRHRMYFYVNYFRTPVGFRESESQYHRSSRQANKNVRELNRFLQSHGHMYGRDSYKHFQYINSFAFQRRLRFYVSQIMSAWGFMYNFDYHSFRSDNFKNFANDDKKVEIQEDDGWYTISEATDWMVILTKINAQLDAIKFDFNDLGSVQKSQYAPYVRVKDQFVGSLVEPLFRNYNKGLKALYDKGNKQYSFEGKFSDVKIDPDNTCTPQIILHDVHRVAEDGSRHFVSRVAVFNYTKQFVKLGELLPGDLIGVRARTEKYIKGAYTKNSVKTIDYKVAYPTKPSIINPVSERNVQPVPENRDALIGYCYEKTSIVYDFPLDGDNYKYLNKCKTAYTNWLKDQAIAKAKAKKNK